LGKRQGTLAATQDERDLETRDSKRENAKQAYVR